MNPWPSSSWHPLILGVTLLAAGALLASWLGWPEARAVWDTLDRAAFFALNGSLAEGGRAWQVLWALANHRLFDLMPALFFFLLFLRYICEGGREQALQRFSVFLFCGLYVLAAVWAGRMAFDFSRLSPTLTEQPAYLLSNMVAWSNAKDTSTGSFPGDHATVALMFAGFLGYFGGRRYGLWGAVVVALASLPRLIGGAHWLTDVLVGAVGIAGIALALALATPLAGMSAQMILSVLRRFPCIERLLHRALIRFL